MSKQQPDAMFFGIWPGSNLFDMPVCPLNVNAVRLNLNELIKSSISFTC